MGSGAWPDELADSELCEKYHWTWAELQATPLYVRRVFAQIQQMKIAKQQQDQEASDAGMAPGSVGGAAR